MIANIDEDEDAWMYMDCDTALNQKLCGGCSTVKDRSEFYARAGAYDGLQSQCKKCLNAHNINRNKARRELAESGGIIAPLTKACSRCKQTKDADQFNSSPRARGGLEYYCKTCQGKATAVCHRKRYADPGKRAQRNNKQRINSIKSNYGLCEREYDALIEKSGGVCDICGKPEQAPDGRRLAIDHDHSTGLVRGILCSKCNRGLGMFQDSPSNLRAAAEYLERHNEGVAS